jgi:diguanylate cyclase (GGDEF)-like protein/PAS domain S-box-containing protein
MSTEILARLNNVLDLMVDAICIVDRRGHFLYVSAAGERIFGYKPEELIGRQMLDLVHPEDRTRTLQAVDTIVAGQPQPHFENRYLRKDGRVVHIMWSASWSETEQVRVAVARDVTERKRAEAKQAALYAIAEAAFSSADLQTLFHGIHRIIAGLLPADNCLVALHDAQQARLSFPYFIDTRLDPPSADPLAANTVCAEVLRSGQARRLLRTEGDTSPVYTDVGDGPLDGLAVPLVGSKGVVGALIVKSYQDGARYADSDIELLQFVSVQVASAIERKQMEAWLQHVANHDRLTGLPNRELFHDRCQAALAHARRDQTGLALLYLDLDRFKQINDQLGHSVGDLLLQEVAQRLRSCVRESDTVGRVGGDEFLVLIHSVAQADHAQLVAEKIRGTISQPFELGGRQLSIAASIGIVLSTEHGDDYPQLMRLADAAMYAAKRRGGDSTELAAALHGG